MDLNGSNGHNAHNGHNGHNGHNAHNGHNGHNGTNGSTMNGCFRESESFGGHHHYGSYPLTGNISSVVNGLHHHAMHNGDPYDHQTSNGNSGNNVLNLSARRPASPYEVSSGTGSGAGSGDDEHDAHQSCDINNSLPLKLRHKSHLGDKDAATALLALQHIKQEPNARMSPPWDGEGSSDERDSGISIDTAEWTVPRKIVLPVVITTAQSSSLSLSLSSSSSSTSSTSSDKEENIHLKTQIARLESEVASIKNMMNIGVPGSAQ